MKTRRVLTLVAGVAALSGVQRASFAADGGPGTDAGPDAAVVRDSGRPDASDAASTDATAPGADAPLPPPTHVVGKACKTAADCADGLNCLTEETNSLGLGGPAGGLCTVDCKEGGQKACDKVDTGSACAFDNSRTVAFCYELCDAGPVAPGQHKCHDRSNMGCYPSPGGAAFCAPLCSSLSDCEGRACDPRSGLCVDQVSQPLTIGTACDPGPPPSGCSGPCSTLGSGMGSMSNSFCSKTCIIGVPNGCEVDPNHTGPATATCALRFADGEADGDVGECMQLCDCDDDCKNPGFICNPRNAEGTGRAGTCYPKLTFTGITPGKPCRSTNIDTEGGAPPPVDAGGPEPDAGAAVSPPLKASGGCDCTVTSRSPARPAGLLTLLAVLGVLGRRRVRPSV